MAENKREGKPWLVRWSGYSAALALFLIGLSVLLVRIGWWQEGLILYALTCLGSCVLFLLLCVLLVLPGLRPWRRGCLSALAFTLPGVLLTISALSQRGAYPPIHDISTDLEDPPVYRHVQSLRGTGANPLAPDPATRELQAQAYPDIATLRSPLAPDAAFARAEAVAREMGWEIVYSNAGEGRIEAVATTAWMGFHDDIVIRLRAVDDGTRLDLRSVSRVGVGDLGANARRITAFQRNFREKE